MIGKALGGASHSLEMPDNKVGEHADDIVTFYVRSSQFAQRIQQEEVRVVDASRGAGSGNTASPCRGRPARRARPAA